jgi:predicted amidohydrolase/ribosomal protein S18 acetylase RimI-like enzyme
MDPRTFPTSRGEAKLRLAELGDIDALIQLNKRCFPAPAEESIVWTRSQLRNHLRVFPDGQIVVEIGGQIVGAAAALIVNLGVDAYRAHTYSGITDGGYFHNHDPEGDTLYGVDVYVDPDFRSMGIGHELYAARRALCKRLNLRRILAGGRIFGYVDHPDLSPEQYVREVETDALTDLVLSFQLREGFVVRGVLRNYVRDPRSRNVATLIEWLNPEHIAERQAGARKVRVAAVQHQVRRTKDFEAFAEQIEYFVEAAAGYRADFVVFPEFVSMQLLSQPEMKRLSAQEGVVQLATLKDQYLELVSSLARRFGIHIVAGTHPMQINGTLYNVCPFVFPDGRVVLQPKLHITPGEKAYWGIEGGNELGIIHTPKAKVGILICYDSEFPEAARYLSDQGAEIIFVPYCTDDRQGYSRVRFCCQARAIENQIYVVTAGIVGNLPSVPAMDIHYGRAAVFTPSDFEFPRDGVAAEADPNVEMLLVTDLDIDDLHRSRSSGSVRPRLDRRRDLFEFRAHLRNDPDEPGLSESLPFDLEVEDAEPTVEIKTA